MNVCYEKKKSSDKFLWLLFVVPYRWRNLFGLHSQNIQVCQESFKCSVAENFLVLSQYQIFK